MKRGSLKIKRGGGRGGGEALPLRGTAAASNSIHTACEPSSSSRRKQEGKAPRISSLREGGCSLLTMHSTQEGSLLFAFAQHLYTHTHTYRHRCKNTEACSQQRHSTHAHTPIPRRRRRLAKRKETKQIDRIQVKSCAPRNTAAVARPLSGSEAQCDAAGMYVHQQPSSSPPSFPSFHRAVLARSRLSICFVVTEKKKNAVLCPTESKNWTHSCS